jgi:hypothetical protein
VSHRSATIARPCFFVATKIATAVPSGRVKSQAWVAKVFCDTATEEVIITPTATLAAAPKRQLTLANSGASIQNVIASARARESGFLLLNDSWQGPKVPRSPS